MTIKQAILAANALLFGGATGNNEEGKRLLGESVKLLGKGYGLEANLVDLCNAYGGADAVPEADIYGLSPAIAEIPVEVPLDIGAGEAPSEDPLPAKKGKKKGPRPDPEGWPQEASPISGGEILVEEPESAGEIPPEAVDTTLEASVHEELPF